MSKIHFLIDKSKNDLFEHVNFFSRDPISHSRQGWRDLVQRILNNELNSNVFQQYNEYKIEENERMYIVHRQSLLCLPSRATIKSKAIPVGSILQYSIIKSSMAHMMIVPSLDQTERNKSITQKRVTIITSPKWRPSIDERHQITSDNLRQKITKIIRKHSNPSDEPLSHTNHLSRLSLRSISYGFDHGKKTRKTIPHENINPSPNYHLPANKIELDLNQQEIIRRTGSFKKSI